MAVWAASANMTLDPVRQYTMAFSTVTAALPTTDAHTAQVVVDDSAGGLPSPFAVPAPVSATGFPLPGEAVDECLTGTTAAVWG